MLARKERGARRRREAARCEAGVAGGRRDSRGAPRVEIYGWRGCATLLTGAATVDVRLLGRTLEVESKITPTWACPNNSRSLSLWPVPSCSR